MYEEGAVGGSGMSRGGLATPDNVDVSPGMTHMTFLMMEDLFDKLKLLNYETEFIKHLKMKPLTRHYFAVQTNPGEQFYFFTSLAAWLIRKMGKSFDQPQEYDDPNSTISTILDYVRQTGASVDFPPSKLKQGFGEYTVSVLDQLADAALSSSHFKWHRPEPVEETEDEEIIEDDAELILERVEEEMAAEYSDDDEEETLIRIEDLHRLQVSNQNSDNQKPEDILLSTTGIDEWKLELERVLPQLKVTIKTDARDWRSHLTQMQQNRSGIEEALETTRVQLDKLHGDISRTLEVISSREKYLNSQLEHYVTDYRRLQDTLSQTNEQYREVNGGVTLKTKTLAEISEQLDNIKQELEDYGTAMTDKTPVINLKKGLAQLKKDIVEMDVRVGVLQHVLLHSKLRDKTDLQQDMNAPVGITA